MNIVATLYDNRNEKIYNISEVIYDVELTTKIEDDPGKATFKILRVDDIGFWEGATVTIQLEGVNMFKGFVFNKKMTQNSEIVQVTCYDQLRYLKNKDSAVFENMTSDQIFAYLCDKFALKYRVVDKSTYKCAPRNNASVALYEMIKTALDDTLINTKKWFFIRDNYGVLEHINVFSLQANVMLGDESGVTAFDYETTIDKNTYNQIKLYRENKNSGKREIFIVNDTVNKGDTLKAWGILQLYEKVADNLNLAQIEAKARGMLALYNNTDKTLKLSCMGIPTMCAGSIFKCSISDLDNTFLNRYMLVTSCSHKITNGQHTMTLETEVVDND